MIVSILEVFNKLMLTDHKYRSGDVRATGPTAGHSEPDNSSIVTWLHVIVSVLIVLFHSHVLPVKRSRYC